jgi:hypothetical protein
MRDPLDTPNGTSSFSVALNFKQETDQKQMAIVKTRHPFPPAARVNFSDICWGFDLNGLFGWLWLIAGNHRPSNGVVGSDLYYSAGMPVPHMNGALWSSDDGNRDPAFGAQLEALDVVSCRARAPFDTNEWRHAAFVVREGSAEVYMEGRLLCNVTFSAPRFQIRDCEGGTIRLGGMETNGASAKWVHGQLHTIQKFNYALTPTEVGELSRCIEGGADNQTFRDALGNTCEWYAESMIGLGYSLCNDETRVHCPIACGASRPCPKQNATDQFLNRVQLFFPPVLCQTPTGAQLLDAKIASYAARRGVLSEDGRRQLSHLPSATIPTVGRYREAGSCAYPVDLANYDLEDFTHVLWTRGQPHRVDLLSMNNSFEYATTGTSLYLRHRCHEFTSHSMNWGHSPQGGADQWWEFTLPSGASITQDEWVMRAVSYNGTHYCFALNTEHVCHRIGPHYGCGRIDTIYVAPMSRSSANLHRMRMSPLRSFSPALSPAALTRLYYNERIHYRRHISGPRFTNAVERRPAPVEVSQYPRRTFNFVPPLALQTRSQSVPCDGFAQKTVELFDSQRAARCAGYECDYPGANTESTPHSVQCIDHEATVHNQTYFGRRPINNAFAE